MRTTRSSLTFSRPFALRGVDGALAAGTYDIETDEESLDVPFRVAYRRVATFIHVQRDGALQVVTVDPADVQMLLRDGVTQGPATVIPAQPAPAGDQR